MNNLTKEIRNKQAQSLTSGVFQVEEVARGCGCMQIYKVSHELMRREFLLFK